MTSNRERYDFSQRSIANAETLGQKLRRMRESSRFTIDQVSERLRIKPEYIAAIEDSRYTVLPSAVFVKNYVQRYVKLLGVSFASVQPLLDAELKVYTSHPNIPTLKRHFTKQALQLRLVVFGSIGLFVVIAIISYFGLEISHSIAPPSLTLATVPSRLDSSEQFVTIAGQTVSEAVVSINDQPIPVAPDGQFSQQMSLQPGSNLLKVEAKTKRSQPNTQYLQIYVEDNKL